MELLIAIFAILISSVAIYFAATRFAESSSKIGDYFNLPKDVKGATFDAIAGSLPELLVALFAVIFFKQFEVGIGTIAGSALFNLLIIPAICVFVAPVAFKVSKKVISRDALFYMISVFLLIILLIYFKVWGLGVAAVLLLVYLMYIKDIVSHTKQHRKKKKKTKTRRKNIKREFLIFFGTMILIGISTFILTKYSIGLSTILGVSPIIIAFTITAAATSIPDTVISVANARKGDIDDATSNVFGSNVFDILVGIGLPLLIYILYKGALAIQFTNLEIVLGLLGSTILILYFFADDHKLSKKQAALLLLMYLAFLAYVIFLSINPL
jgi:cation:H+ antiporter